jgi:acyl carrier protein
MTSLLSTSMMNNTPKRMMSGGNFLSEEEVEARVLFVLSKINKIHDNPQALRTLSKDSTFESLGLDSLDQVEVIMQLEEEFVVDLQDDEAGKMTTVRDCIRVFSNFPYAIPIRGGFH